MPPAHEARAAFVISLDFQKQTLRVFKGFFHPHEECHRAFAVNNTVIIRQGKIHHRTRHNLAIDNNRTLLDTVHPKDTRLRCIQDWR